MKRLAAILIASIFLFAGIAVSAADAQDIYIRSQTPVVSSQTLRNDLVAFQTGENKLERWWGGEHRTLHVGKAPKGAWQITLKNSDNPYDAGWHSTNPWDVPYAVVFAANYPEMWTLILSHELFEMSVDPQIDRTAVGSVPWLVEVGDPVELFGFPVRTANGSFIKISDFVGPAWYTANGPGPYDYMRLVKRPETLLPGGYAVYWDGDDWAELDG